VWKQPKERFNIITQWLTVYVLAKVYFLYEQFLMFDLSFLVGYCTLLGNTEKFLPHTIQNANVQMVWGTPLVQASFNWFMKGSHPVHNANSVDENSNNNNMTHNDTHGLSSNIPKVYNMP